MFTKTIDSPAPLPLDPSGGEGQAVPVYGAGGTPALPGGLHPMTGSRQGDKIAGAFQDRLPLKELSPYLCLFVFIRGSSFIDAPLFHPQRVRNVVGGGGTACLKQIWRPDN